MSEAKKILIHIRNADTYGWVGCDEVAPEYLERKKIRHCRTEYDVVRVEDGISDSGWNVTFVFVRPAANEMGFPEKCQKMPVMSAALQRWTVEQQRLIHDTLDRTNRRPDELVLPQELRADADDFMRQMGVAGPLDGMRAFGIPVRLAEKPAGG